MPNNSFVSSIRWTIAAGDQFSYTRCRKHLLNSPKRNPQLRLSRRPQQQAIITHVAIIDEVWGWFITASLHRTQWQCRWSSGTWKNGARQKQDHNPRLPKNRLHQSRTTCSLRNPWDTAPWRERGAEELPNARQFGGVDSCSTHNLQCCIWNTTTSSGCLSTRDTCLLEWVLRKATKMPKELEVLPYEEKLSKQRLFSCERRNLGGWGWNSLHVNISTSTWQREQRWWKHF